MTKDELKRRLLEAVDRRAADIIGIGERIWRNPELGFKEVKTAKLVEETMRSIGLAPRTGLAFTGVRAEAAGGRGAGPTFALIGWLDALAVAGHPAADPLTGAAHACGHNAQVAGMLGAAMALHDTGVMAHLAGRVVFFAVPAEEGGDLEWRVSQRAAGALELFGGKPELMRLGHFDDVDLAMMIHTTSRPEDGRAAVPLSNNGRVGKIARYVGRPAHAGRAPPQGSHAPTPPQGGTQVNVIPGEARIQTYVRGRTLDAILDANAKVDRALRAGALALGARVEIDTLHGYLPLASDGTMARYFRESAGALVGAEHYRDLGHRTGSTDMGDLSQVIPVLHPYMGGATGTGHAADYAIVDKPLAYVAPAKALAAMAVDMLWDDGAGARDVLAHARPR